MSSTVMRHQFNINKNSPYDPLVAVRVRLHIDGIFRILMIAHDAAFNAFPIVNVSPYRRGCFAWSEPHKIFSSPKPSRPLHTSSNMSFLCKKKQKQGNGKVANTKLWLDIAWMNDRGWARATQREKKKLFLLLRLRGRYMAGEGGWDVAEEVARWVFLSLFFSPASCVRVKMSLIVCTRHFLRTRVLA